MKLKNCWSWLVGAFLASCWMQSAAISADHYGGWDIGAPQATQYPYPGHPYAGVGAQTNDWSNPRIVVRAGPNTASYLGTLSVDYNASDWRLLGETGWSSFIVRYTGKNADTMMWGFDPPTNSTPWVLDENFWEWHMKSTGTTNAQSIATRINWWRYPHGYFAGFVWTELWSFDYWAAGASLDLLNTNTGVSRTIEIRLQTVDASGEPLRLVSSAASDYLSSSVSTSGSVYAPRIEYAPPGSGSSYRRDITCKVTWATMDNFGAISESSATYNYANQITWAYEDLFDNADERLYEFCVEVWTKTPGTNTQTGYRKFRWFR